MRYMLLSLTMIMVAPALASPDLERAPVNGGYLTYQQNGEGEAVFTIHGALVADAFLPIMDQPALDGYRVIRYQRSGHAHSASLDISPADFLDRAVADALALLDHLNVERAHVVGHSSGAVIAMALALNSPDRVHSLVLLEPPMAMVPAAEELFETIGKATSYHQAGDSAAGVDAFLTRLTGPEWQELMASQVPGAKDQAIADAASFFDIEVPGLAEFEFDVERASRLTMPALYVLGTESSAIANAAGFFEQGKEFLMKALPNAESITLEGMNHSMQIGFPETLAQTIAEFAARHPIDN